VSSYALVTRVIQELGAYGKHLTGTSVPTQTQVTNDILPDIAGEIDGVLAERGLAVPVTLAGLTALGVDATVADRFIKHLEGLNALGAAARAAAQLAPQLATKEDSSFPKWLLDLYNAGLARLRSGEGVPKASVGSAGLPSAHWTTNPTDPDTDEEWTPMITRRGLIW